MKYFKAVNTFFPFFLISSTWETWVFSTSLLEVGKFFNCKLLNFDDKFFNLVTVAVHEMAFVNIRVHVMMTWISDQISNSPFKPSRHLLRGQLGIYLRHPCKYSYHLRVYWICEKWAFIFSL